MNSPRTPGSDGGADPTPDVSALAARVEALEKGLEELAARAVSRDLLDRELARIDRELDELRETEEI